MSNLSEAQWVSIIAMLGWLVLVAGAYRSHQIDTSRTIRMALIWASIFAAVAFVFSFIG